MLSTSNLIATTLALVSVSVLLPAVILLARGSDNAPIKIIPPEPAASTTAPPAKLRVHIGGAIKQAGVYTVAPEDRLVDLLETAGGPTAEANLIAVNLAARMRDEGYYYIPRVDETPPPIVGVLERTAQPAADAISATRGDDRDANLVDLNTATLAALMDLPGIGEVKAQAIIDYRESRGLLQSIEAITNVEGIGPRTLDKIRNLVVVKAQ